MSRKYSKSKNDILFIDVDSIGIIVGYDLPRCLLIYRRSSLGGKTKGVLFMYYAGVDLLKILAMLFIVCHHLLTHGGVINAASSGIPTAVIWLFEVICYCGVNIYAIISGFLGYHSKHKYSRYIALWLEVVFYCIVMSVVCMIVSPGSVGLKGLAKSFLPITFNQYWYFSAYTGTFLLMPVINLVVEKMDELQTKRALLVCILAFSCYASLGSRYSDAFKLNWGYSIVWLSILYFFGAVIRKYDLQTKVDKKKVLIGIVILYLFTWIWKIAIGQVLGHGLDGLFTSYLSPTLVGISFGLVLLFCDLRLSHYKWLKFMGPATFGVYLFHEQGSFVKLLITDRIAFAASFNPILTILVVLGIAVVLFACGIIIDKCRGLLFKLLRIKPLSERLETFGKRKVDGLISRLNSWK